MFNYVHIYICIYILCNKIYDLKLTNHGVGLAKSPKYNCHQQHIPTDLQKEILYLDPHTHRHTNTHTHTHTHTHAYKHSQHTHIHASIIAIVNTHIM